jgi:hypothetical protein
MSLTYVKPAFVLDSSWNVMAHGDAREGKWSRDWRMECVASTIHATSEHGLSSVSTADAHTSAAISRLNWRPCRFKWTRPFRRKTKSGFCACAITFQMQSTSVCWLWKTNMYVFGLQQYVAFKTLYMARRTLYAYTSCPWNCASKNGVVWNVTSLLSDIIT